MANGDSSTTSHEAELKAFLTALAAAEDKVHQLRVLLREARASRAVDFVPNDWANRVDKALENGR